jgi:putative phosphoesterase
VLVGILSDTHDRVEATHVAVALLRGGGAEFFIHCGDVGSELVLDALAGLPSAFVFGNCDWDRRGIERYAAQIHVSCLGQSGELDLGGKIFFVTHGDDARALKQGLDSQRFDYVLHGHTHVRRDERIGKTRVINPGALHRAKEKTVAIVDTARDALTFLTVSA